MTEPYEGYDNEGHDDEVASDDVLEPEPDPKPFQHWPSLSDRCFCDLPGRWCPVHDE